MVCCCLLLGFGPELWFVSGSSYWFCVCLVGCFVDSCVIVS